MRSEDKPDWPVCLPCWRQGYSMTEDPPVKMRRDEEGKLRRAWPEERCSVPVCGRRTNHGIYVDVNRVGEITITLVRAHARERMR